MLVPILSCIIQVLCGNKSDLEEERQVPTQEGQLAARERNIIFIETSAKTGAKVEEMFHQLVRTIPREGKCYKVTNV